MNVQSISCQPIKQAYKAQSFGGPSTFDDDRDFLHELEEEREAYQELANKKGSMLSAIGMLGVGIVGAALSFFTFKAVAPKGYQTLKTMYQKTTDFGPVKSTIEFFKRNLKKVWTFTTEQLSKLNKKIKPDSKLGKAKAKVGGFFTNSVKPRWTKMKDAVKAFAEKHNINKLWFKKAALNTGAAAAAVPAGITAANVNQEEK